MALGNFKENLEKAKESELPGALWSKIFALIIAVAVVFAMSSMISGYYYEDAANASDKKMPHADSKEQDWFFYAVEKIKILDREIAILDKREIEAKKTFEQKYGQNYDAWSLFEKFDYKREMLQHRNSLCAIVFQRNALVRKYNEKAEKIHPDGITCKLPKRFSEYEIQR